jgi:hypothetical protein
VSHENIAKKRGKPFTRGNPGRPKGVPNKKTMAEREAAEWARTYALDSGAFQDAWIKICDLARRGVQWAAEMVIERAAGKKPLEITTPEDRKLEIVIHRTEK